MFSRAVSRDFAGGAPRRLVAAGFASIVPGLVPAISPASPTVRRGRRPRRAAAGTGPFEERSLTMMAPATFILGMATFALFFGLVAACDRL